MIIDVENVFHEEGLEVPFDYLLDLTYFCIGTEKPFSKPVHVTGRVFNRVGIVTLEASARVEMATFCDRCAEEVKTAFDAKVSRILVKEPAVEANDDYYPIDSWDLDLDIPVMEEIFLEMPTKVLCMLDCKGVCPGCGKNLNEDQCDCKKAIDPRLESLRQLLDSNN